MMKEKNMKNRGRKRRRLRCNNHKTLQRPGCRIAPTDHNKAISWNYQGLRNPWTSHSLRKFVKDQVLDVHFLMETRLNEDGFNDLYRDLPFKNKLFVKKPNAGGGLALLWK